MDDKKMKTNAKDARGESAGEEKEPVNKKEKGKAGQCACGCSEEKDAKNAKAEDTEGTAAEAAEVKKALDALAEKEKELAELNDRYLRMAAEYDNFRRRSAKEREGVYADAMSDTVRAILPIFDNLERAAQYKDSDAANVVKGLEMTLKSFEGAFAKLGIKEVGAVGETFDPNLHNAVMHVEDDEHGEGEIVEILQKGFSKGDKVIRHAMVKVAN